MQCRIYEVGISYDGRGYQEGKKIGWKDAVWAFVCVVRYGLFHRPVRTIESVLEMGTGAPPAASESPKKPETGVATPPQEEAKVAELA